MFKINDKITVDLTSCVDVESLLELKPYVDYAVAKHHELQMPAQYGGDLFLNKGTGFFDISEELKLDLINKYPYIGDLNYKQLLLWLRYNMDIKYGQCHLHVIKPHSWETKNLSAHCDKCVPYESFKPLLDWVDSQNIFSDYGRVNLFINEPYTLTPIHYDPPSNEYTDKDQFIWITLDDRKKFFVYDPESKTKPYLTGYIGTFDNHNYHGSEATEFASYSIRVDGVFSKLFLDKSGMAGHF
jgi:hypothetical protein